VISLMSNLNQKLGITFIVATHNLHLVDIANHSFQMIDGELDIFLPQSITP
jgi:ABC-type lipoprotein export system ATPase subunit